MVKTEEILRLIVIDDSSNHAEQVSNMLRNAGQAVRAERAEDDEDLRELLAKQGWDMVLSKANLAHFSAIDALPILAHMETEIPLVVLFESFDETVAAKYLDAGARDVVSLAHPRYLVHTLIREFSDVLARRRHRQCQTLLTEANRRAQGLVDSSRDAIAYVHEGMYIYANESYLKKFGYTSLEDIEGMPLMDMVAPPDQGKFKEFLRGYLRGQAGADTLDVLGCKADGGEFKITMNFSAASFEGEPCIQIVIRDQAVNQAVNKELKAKLDSLTKYDLLTGTCNRQYFMSVLQELVGKQGLHGSLLYIAPDDFKSVRERLGIAGSDLVVTDFALLLKKFLIGKNDLVARFDGEVFTLLLRGVDEKHAETIANKITQTVGDTIFDAKGQSTSLSCRIGIARYHEHLPDENELIQRSETAYRKAVASGAQVYLYNPQTEGMGAGEQASLRIQQLKDALRSNRFQLLYQPIVSLQGDSAENYEVLLRMLDDKGQAISPSEFMAAAEQAGLANGVDRWVLAHAVKALVERRRAGKHTNLFVKLTGKTLHDDKLLGWLQELLSASKLDGQHLVILLKESDVSSNLKQVKPFIDGLHQLRIKAGIEHFGLSANCTNLLRHADADYLKLDGSLIRDVAQNEKHQARVKELSAMATEAGKKTIATFVEDATTLSTLWSCGPDYIQGHFLQEPSPDMSYEFS